MAGGPDGVLLVDKPAGITSTRALALAKRSPRIPEGRPYGDARPLCHRAAAPRLRRGDQVLALPDRFRQVLRRDSPPGSHIDDRRHRGRNRHPIARQVGAWRRSNAVSREFVGISTQIPPMHSAVRVQGKRLYDLARQGVEVAREPRAIRIDFLEIIEFSGEKLVISVKCSKGTYVRTLAETIGERLGCGAYLTDLRRTAAAGISMSTMPPRPTRLAAMGTRCRPGKAPAGRSPGRDRFPGPT